MDEFLQGCFSWPTWPATVLLLMVLVYWLLVIVGAVDLELLNFDFELDIDVGGSVLDLGFVPFRFLNLGSVPVMLWISICSSIAWLTTRLISVPEPHPTFDLAADGKALLRDFGIAIMATKFITNPLRGRFDPVEPNRAQDLIGRTCVVTTSEVTQSFGEAQFATEGAPLILNIRATEEQLTKGDVAKIVDFTPEKNIYYVMKSDREV